MDPLNALRLISGASWAVSFTVFIPALVRSLSSRRKIGDTRKAAVWFTAAVMIGFPIRWLVFPSNSVFGNEYTVWAGLYALSTIAGQLQFWTSWDE